MSSPSKKRLKRQTWCKRLMHKRVPLASWLPLYNSEKGVADFIAGVTVGLTVIPQALAYATLAGLDPQDGLYSSFMGCFIYTIFGSCKDITLGPTALMALMTYQQIQNRNADYAVLLCFLTGVVQFIMGILHLGVLIDFISVPVTVGFTSATSVIIAVSQIKSLLGLQFKSGGFLDTVKQVVINLPNARLADSALGISCIVILLLMRKLKDLNLPSGRKGLKKTLWLLSTSRNAIVVVLCSVAAFVMEQNSGSSFKLTGTVREGLPSWSVPPFETSFGGRNVTFIEMCSDLGSSIVLVPVIGVLGNVAIAKAFASGSTVDATQELLTLSLSNVLGSFVGAMPITGSFSRSAVNHASGVATQMGSVYTGVLVLLALSLLTPYFYYIPKASLAAVVICAVIFMIEYEVVKPMWRSRRADLVPAFATFAICLAVGVELGILAGVAVNVILLLYPSARPQLDAEIVTVIIFEFLIKSLIAYHRCVGIGELTSCRRSLRSPFCLAVGVELGILAGVAVNVILLLYPRARPQLDAEIVTNSSGFSYVLVTVGNSLYFPGVEYIRQYVERAAKKQGGCSMPIVIDCRYVLGADFTAAKGICALSSSLSARGQPLVLLSPRASVAAVLSGAGSDALVVLTAAELDAALQARGQPLVLLSPRASVAAVLSGAGSDALVVLTAAELDAALQDLTGNIALPLIKETRNTTPPPNYDSIRQPDDDVTEVVIAESRNTTPLLNGNRDAHAHKINGT